MSNPIVGTQVRWAWQVVKDSWTDLVEAIAPPTYKADRAVKNYEEAAGRPYQQVPMSKSDRNLYTALTLIGIGLCVVIVITLVILVILAITET